ncbi:MAG TPA: shikimate dehydrogenase, partial [Spirochaetota bacterium]|nr:shikimate dehydrogenase [Spirochaetota bacterium]
CASERGAQTIHGIEMLIRQGAEQFRIWTGMEPPVALMREKAINGAYHR